MYVTDDLPRAERPGHPAPLPPPVLCVNRHYCCHGTVVDRSPITGVVKFEQVDSDDVEIRRSKFHFVDLAGSERAKRTGASGQRFKEVLLSVQNWFQTRSGVVGGAGKGSEAHGCVALAWSYGGGLWQLSARLCGVQTVGEGLL